MTENITTENITTESTQQASTAGTILLAGGTGKTGHRVAQRLAARGVPVRVGSRSGAPPFDWEEPATWAPALAGTAAAYLAYYPDLAAPGAAEAVSAFTDRAVASGVRRLVLLSGRNEPEAQRCEELVGGHDLDVTVVRAGVFSQNFSEGILRKAVMAGVVALPAGDVAEPFVDADDIADVAVAALTEPGHAGQVYEVTGPRLLSFAEALAEIAAASGRQVRYQPVSPAEYVEMLAAQGVPREDAGFLAGLFEAIFDGRNAHLTDGVERALGRKPRDFADYARATAAAGAWREG